MSRDVEYRNLTSSIKPPLYDRGIMADDITPANTINSPSIRGGTLLDTDSYPSEEFRLPAKAKFALIAVFTAQVLAAVSVTIIQSTLFIIGTDLLQYERGNAIAISLVFASVTYVSSIIGGILADIKFGCYNVSFLACCLLMLGQTISFLGYLFVYKIDEQRTLLRITYVVGVMLIAVGQGLFNVAIVPLGMRHMVNQETPERLSIPRQQMYLRWFVFAYAFGTLVAFYYLSQQDLLLGTNSETRWKRQLSSSLPLWATGGMTFILIMGKRFYPPDSIQLGRSQLASFVGALLLKLNSVNLGDKRELLRLIGLQLLAFSTLSAYLAIYFQTDNTYMDQLRNLTESKTNVSYQPPLSKNMAVYHPVFAMLTVLVLAIFNRCVFTCLHWHRVTIGIFMSAISIACASKVEMYIAEGQFISYYWLLPQFAFMGISEAFYFVGGYEMCYAISVRGFETATLGLFLGVGSFCSIFVYIEFIIGPDDHKTFVYLFLILFILAILTMALFIFFILRCMRTRKNLPSHLLEPPPGVAPTVTSDDCQRRSRPAAIWDNF